MNKEGEYRITNESSLFLCIKSELDKKKNNHLLCLKVITTSTCCAFSLNPEIYLAWKSVFSPIFLLFRLTKLNSTQFAGKILNVRDFEELKNIEVALKYGIVIVIHRALKVTF